MSNAAGGSAGSGVSISPSTSVPINILLLIQNELLGQVCVDCVSHQYLFCQKEVKHTQKEEQVEEDPK